MFPPKNRLPGFACPSPGGFFWALSFDGFPSAFLGGESVQQNPKVFTGILTSGVTRSHSVPEVGFLAV